MFITVSEIGLEAVTQGTTSEHLDIKLQLSKCILPLRGVPY
jgi:hypothetical protein